MRHWREYAIDGALLAGFMVAACVTTVGLEHPASPLRQAIANDLARRALAGVAMGLTAIVLVYSPWGQRSGAHMNPAVTLTFWRLGRIGGGDALGYVVGQFAGAWAGVAAVHAVLGERLADPAVRFAVTVPGSGGVAGAFVAEGAIAFGLMLAVLTMGNQPRRAPYTGVVCGVLVAIYITVEAPLSGMSMNPARTFGSAAVAGDWRSFWLYLLAPPLGMFAAAAVDARWRGVEWAPCAKLHHATHRRCIFCEWRGVPAAVVLATAVGIVAGLGVSGSAWADAPPAVRAVDAVAITVSDMTRSLDFYSRVLGFVPVADVEVAGEGYERLRGVFPVRLRVVRLRLGDEFLELDEYLAPRGRPAPVDARSNDAVFQHVALVVRDMNRAYRWLHDQHVPQISSEPQRLPDWNPNAGGIQAFYFRDPDGHPLELIWFPPGKGDARWQEPTDRIFLGIDHTAIAVGDTAASLRFYRDRLGMQVAGRSENSGPEQDRLNGVVGSRVRITGLRAARGPGIELLEYLAPRDGRPYPADERANDLVHWQTRVVATDAATVASLAAGATAQLPDRTLGFAVGGVVRDPDGHALEVVGP